MARAGQSVRAKRDDRNADLAAERAAVTADPGEDSVETENVVPGAAATWLRLQKGNPEANPWRSPTFLVNAWSLASEDVDVPLLRARPTPQELGKWREICGLSIEAVAQRAQVSAQQYSEFEAGNEQIRKHLNESQLLKFASVMAVCVKAGGPPKSGTPEPIPARESLRIVGVELLAELAKEVGDVPLAHVVLDNRTSTHVARGELPSPTLTDYPSEVEARRLIAAFPGLANRRRSVAWTSSSALADFMDRPDFTAQRFQARDDLGVGKAGMLRLWGLMAAIVEADPGRVALIEAERDAAEQRHREQEASAVAARAAVAQANLILATVEAEKANAAVREGAA